MNSEQGVYMDTEAVRGMAKTFGTIGDILRTVAKTLESLMMVLKTTAFIGMVGGYAVAKYIETMKPPIEEMSEKCEELSKDLDASVLAYEQGDELGSTRFH